MAQDPWAEFRGGSQQTRSPAPIMGPPPTAKPYEDDKERREEERLRLAREAAARDAAKDYQDIQIAQRKIDAGPQAEAVEGEKKAAAFLIRALGANESYEGLKIGPRSLVGQTLADAFPNALNTLPGAVGNSPRRQVADTNQDEFIAASLRQDSGAAIPPEELERQRRIYFPMPGDGPEAIEAKRQARIRAIEGLRQSAGRLEGSAEERYNRLLEQLKREQSDDVTGTFTDEGGFNVRVTDDSPTSPTGGGGRYSLDNIALALGQGAGSLVEGVGNIAGMAINPVGQAMYDLFGVNQTYDTGQILREGLGLPENPNQLNDAIIQGASGAMMGGLGARAAMSLTNPGVARNVLSVIGETPIRDAAAGAGAGAGSTIAQDYGPVAQTAAAISGGALGYGGASAAARTLQPRVMSPVGNAMLRQNVDLLPADVAGAATRGLTTAAKTSPFSAQPVAAQARRAEDQMSAAARRIAESQGSVVTSDVAGSSIRDAAEAFSRRSSELGGRMYDRAYRLAEGVRIVPARTVARLNERIARLRENPAATPAQIKELESFRDGIAGGVGIRGLRDARTELSQGTFDGKLRSTTEKQMWKEVLGDLSQDIRDGLVEQGRDQAADAFQRADDYWSARVNHIDTVLEPLLGRGKGGEQILKTVEDMARGQAGGGVRLSKLLAQMKPEEAGQVRAAIVDRLGRAKPGAQDASGEAFSASTFLTNWNQMTPQARASLFADARLRRDLSDLALLAEKSKATQAAANHSNTGMAVYGNIGAQAMFAANHPAAALLGVGAQYLTGKLLASPKFAHLLARSAKEPPKKAHRTLTQQLGVLASREPALRTDIMGVQQFITGGFAQSPTRAAAQGQEVDDRGQVPPQY